MEPDAPLMDNHCVTEVATLGLSASDRSPARLALSTPSQGAGGGDLVDAVLVEVRGEGGG